MISATTLAILCCPETHQPLALADAALVARLNKLQASGVLKNRVAKPVTAALDEGLLRQDGKIVYPVRQNIPVMLIDEGIPIE